MNLLAALEIIGNASDECLHSHATQIILTLGRVGQRLQHNLLIGPPSFHPTPRHPSSVPTSSQSPQIIHTAGSLSLQTNPWDPRVPSPPQSPQFSQLAGSPASQVTTFSQSHDVRPTQSPQLSVLQDSNQSLASPESTLRPCGGSSPLPPDHVPDLLKRIKKSVYWVSEISQQEHSSILSRKPTSEADIRLDHIRLVEGDRSIDNEAKLIRLLALRSIAQEFTNGQIEDMVTPTKLEELCHHALLPKPNGDNIFKYDSKDFSSKALSTGLKHLAMENIIASQFQQLPSIYNAISAVVGLHIDQFRRLRYNEMPNLAIKLLSETDLLILLQRLSLWFNELQTSYNGELFYFVYAVALY
ncbi:hypothetical protein N7540_011099 [Penicillium herquei]|nr:hypothetical protein N7540_011099 [Penicillium herquei]